MIACGCRGIFLGRDSGPPEWNARFKYLCLLCLHCLRWFTMHRTTGFDESSFSKLEIQVQWNLKQTFLDLLLPGKPFFVNNCSKVVFLVAIFGVESFVKRLASRVVVTVDFAISQGNTSCHTNTDIIRIPQFFHNATGMKRNSTQHNF